MTVGKLNKSRSQGYAMLVEAISKQSKGRLNINGKNMCKQFQQHMKVHTTTKAKASGMAFGITEGGHKEWDIHCSTQAGEYVHLLYQDGCAPWALAKHHSSFPSMSWY